MTLLERGLVVSVVVPVYNNAETIRQCLDSLLSQSYKDIEIIVVDDGSTDGTRDVVRGFPVKLIAVDHQGSSHARNVGIKEAEGQIIGFAEGDATYDKDYLARSVAHFADANVGGVIGPYFVKNPRNFLTRCKDVERRTHFSEYRPFTGWVYRKAVLELIGYFDERLSCGEDVDVGIRTRRAGFKIVYEPDAKWWHEEAERWSELLGRQFWYGREIIPFYAKQGDLPIPSIPTILFLASIPLSLFLPSLSVAPVLLFVYALAGGVTVRRLRWMRRAIRVTGDFTHSLGYLFIHFLIKLAQTLGLIAGLFKWRRVRAFFPSRTGRLVTASKLVRGVVYSILYDA